MSLKLVTAPTSEPLDLENVKNHLRVWDDEEDSYISGLISAARQLAEVRLRRSLITTTWRQTFPCLPRGGVIELSRPPLIAVSSFVYTDEDGATQTVSSSLYETDADCEPGRIVRKYNQTWPTVRVSGEATPVQVTYTAGYGAAADVPQAIKHAMLLLIGHWYEHREAVMHGVTPTEVPQAVASLLTAYSWGDYP